ncbi:MAG TPA: ABC transporter ATP-binding protein [Phycisphaerales bacterium]|nr:ABC transporter ATP-binding protein [Phycisphaerales bacterium]
MTLAADHIDFAYRRGHPVLSGISLTIHPGRVVALLGPNGSGKTTLLRLLAGMIKPQAGSITIDGHQTHELNAHDRAQRLAYVPQNPALAFPFDLSRYVGFGRFALGNQDKVERVRRAIDRLDLTHKAHEPVGELSAGQRQRAAIARALCQLGEEPAPGFTRILLADEPTASLDPKHVVRVMELLKDLKEIGVGVVLVLHDLASAARWADHAILLDSAGTLLTEGTPDNALNDDSLQRAFGIGFQRIEREGELLALRPVQMR